MCFMLFQYYYYKPKFEEHHIISRAVQVSPFLPSVAPPLPILRLARSLLSLQDYNRLMYSSLLASSHDLKLSPFPSESALIFVTSTFSTSHNSRRCLPEVHTIERTIQASILKILGKDLTSRFFKYSRTTIGLGLKLGTYRRIYPSEIQRRRRLTIVRSLETSSTRHVHFVVGVLLHTET